MTLWLFQYADAETGDGDTSDIEDDESSLGSCSSSSDITIDCDESHEANDDVTKITENEEEEISALWISPKAELLSTIFLKIILRSVLKYLVSIDSIWRPYRNIFKLKHLYRIS